MQRILIAVTSCEHKGDSGESTGYELTEVSHAYLIFRDQGYEVDFVSPKGGNPPIEKYNLSDVINRAFLEDQDAQERIRHSFRPEQLYAHNYEAIYFAGGFGTMWDFPDNAALQDLTRSVYESGGIVGAVCHGPAALVNLQLSDGRYLVAGKAVCAFTNAEESASGHLSLMPFSLENNLRERGAVLRKASPFSRHREVSGRLVTGQNQASTESVARAMVELLEQRQQKRDAYPQAS